MGRQVGRVSGLNRQSPLFQNFVRPIGLLLRLRWQLTRRTYLKSSSALVGIVMVLFIFGPAALAAGTDVRQNLAGLDATDQEALLRGLLLGAQAICLMLLLPGSAALIGQSISAAILRPFPVRPGAIISAGVLGSLLDLPLLLALPLLGGVVLGVGGNPLALALTVLALFLFIAQTFSLGQLVEQLAGLLSRRRRLSFSFVAVTFLVAWIMVGLPSALQAAPPTKNDSLTLRRAKLVPAWTAILPSGLTAGAVAAASRGSWGISLAYLLGLATTTGLTFAGAVRLLQNAILREEGSSSTERPQSEQKTATTPQTESRTTGYALVLDSPLATMVRTEVRNLVRNPTSHLPLRQPAFLLLACGYGWIAPNLGQDAIRNIGDLLGMGGIIYALLWQIQLLCNRFGNEAGTAALLFRFPMLRHRLLLAKNLALLGLLLFVDGVLLSGFCLAARHSEWLGPLWFSLPLLLILGSLLGNIVSVLLPFSIARREKGAQPEPDRSVLFLYALFGTGVGVGLWIIHTAFAASIWLGLLSIVALFLLYAASIWLSARILQQTEQRLIRTLDS